MNKIMATFFVLLLSFTATTYPISETRAAGLSEQSMTFFHPNDTKTVAMGKETFTYTTFDSDASPVLSKTEITQPPEYEGLLLKKHILQAPEEIYILDIHKISSVAKKYGIEFLN